MFLYFFNNNPICFLTCKIVNILIDRCGYDVVENSSLIGICRVGVLYYTSSLFIAWYSIRPLMEVSSIVFRSIPNSLAVSRSNSA